MKVTRSHKKLTRSLATPTQAWKSNKGQFQALPKMSKQAVMEVFPMSDSGQIAQRLKQARIKAGYKSAQEACRKLGWSYAQYAKHENGQRTVHVDDAMRYAAAFHINLDQLLYGEIENRDDNAQRGLIVPSALKLFPQIELDQIALMQKMYAREAIFYQKRVAVPPDAAYDGEGIVIEIRDSAMTKPGDRRSLEAGASVLIATEERPTPSNIVLALVHGERAAVLRIYREIERRGDFVVYELVPLNPDFRTVRVEKPGDAMILGVAVYAWKARSLT